MKQQSPPYPDGKRSRRHRRRALLAMLITIPLGFLLKYGKWGPLTPWAHAHGAGAAYVAFWIFLCVAVAPRLSPARTAAVVLAVVCLLEGLQAIRIPWLEPVRNTTLGAWLLGAEFDWADFPWYVVGALGAGALLCIPPKPGHDRRKNPPAPGTA